MASLLPAQRDGNALGPSLPSSWGASPDTDPTYHSSFLSDRVVVVGEGLPTVQDRDPLLQLLKDRAQEERVEEGLELDWPSPRGGRGETGGGDVSVWDMSRRQVEGKTGQE